MADQNAQNQDNIPKLPFQDAVISDEVQQRLNQPLANPESMDPKDEQFLAMIMEKVDKGEINLYRPSTMINYVVYDKLDANLQAKVETDAFNLLATIREIRGLWSMGDRNTYQVENLTHKIRVTKERLETAQGDVYII
ncbi:MAG: hypothetical protein WC843_03430 [Candidatus Gracilibacteria bacterium]|jgi:hypothetical protein